jgi:hypothetical protein
MNSKLHHSFSTNSFHLFHTLKQEPAALDTVTVRLANIMTRADAAFDILEQVSSAPGEEFAELDRLAQKLEQSFQTGQMLSSGIPLKIHGLICTLSSLNIDTDDKEKCDNAVEHLIHVANELKQITNLLVADQAIKAFRGNQA